MKKIIFLISIHFTAFAQPVFCPEEVICEQELNVGSCHFQSKSSHAWNKIMGKNISIGRYINTYVSAPYYSYDQGYALCVYKHETQGNTLTLHAKPEANLEMLIQDHEPWRSEETWWECAPKYEGACPLQEQAALLIKNQTDEMIYLSNDVSIQPGQFARMYEIDFTQAWVDIFDASNYLGRIKVDLKNRLKIKGIIDSDAESAALEQIEGFNAVQVAEGG